MKKICIVMPGFMSVPNYSGGAVELLMSIIYDINKIEKKLDITIYSTKQVRLNFLDKFLNILYRIVKKIFHIKFFQFDRYYYKIYKNIKKEKFDFVILEAGDIPKLEKFIINVAKIIKKEKFIYHIHMDIANFSYRYKKLLSEHFGHFINVSQKMNDLFLNSYEIAPEKSHILYNCTNEKDFKKIDKIKLNKLKEKYNITKNDFVIIFVGRLVKEKGVLELIQSVKKINKSNIKLICCGSDFSSNKNQTEYIMNLQKEIKNNNNIILTGQIPHGELINYYKLATIQVIPSIWEEAAGLVALEGMINGLPLIITNSGGMVEYVDENNALIIANDNDIIDNLSLAILDLYNDINKRKYMSRNSLIKSKQFSSQQYYHDFVNYINKIS